MLVAAEPPEHLIELFDARRRKLDGLLPELRSLYNRASGKPRVRFYQGPEGIKVGTQRHARARDKKLLGILSMRDLYEVPGREWMDDLVRRRIEAGFFCASSARRPRTSRTCGRKAQPICARSGSHRARMVFTMTSYIYDDKVAIISSRRENFAMTIESEEFAMMQTKPVRDVLGLLSGAATRRPQGRCRHASWLREKA